MFYCRLDYTVTRLILFFLSVEMHFAKKIVNCFRFLGLLRCFSVEPAKEQKAPQNGFVEVL